MYGTGFISYTPPQTVYGFDLIMDNHQNGITLLKLITVDKTMLLFSTMTTPPPPPLHPSLFPIKHKWM